MVHDVTSQDAKVRVIRHAAKAGGQWAELVLNRPQRKNAITGPLGEALAQTVNALNEDSAIQVILLRGAEGAFCSGLDLEAFNAQPSPPWLANFPKVWRAAHEALFCCEKPIVGALERYAINGGAALASACDHLFMGREAFLQVGEVQIGMAAPYNLAWLTLRHSEASIAQACLLGERMKADDMLRLGLASEVVDDARVVSSAVALCQRMADFPPGAPARIKTGLRANVRESASEWFDRFTALATGGASPPGKP